MPEVALGRSYRFPQVHLRFGGLFFSGDGRCSVDLARVCWYYRMRRLHYAQSWHEALTGNVGDCSEPAAAPVAEAATVGQNQPCHAFVRATLL